MPLPTTGAPDDLRGPRVEPKHLVDQAIARLAQSKGFTSRPQQAHLARLVSDLIEGRSSGVFEAPTGLGKSLAVLIPAIANAIVHKRRTVIATYTNVLAEQYWRSDLPLALSLFDPSRWPLPTARLLMGRSRYACLEALDLAAPDLLPLVSRAEIGHETDFRALSALGDKPSGVLWRQVAAPPVCPARSCRFYGDCFYYRSRREAQHAAIVVTNHSVVLQHALMTRREEGEGLLGDFDFLVIDEAHDFPSAAQNGLEFELGPSRLRSMIGIAARIESALERVSDEPHEQSGWKQECAAFRGELESALNDLVGFGMILDRQSILECAPESLLDHPQVKSRRSEELRREVSHLADAISDSCQKFDLRVEGGLTRIQQRAPDRARAVTDEIRNYRTYLTEISTASAALFNPDGVAVTYVGREGQDPMVRQDVIELAQPLRDLVWNATPYACLSATLSLDGSFDFFKRLTGVEPQFEEVLPSPFDHARQSAVYLPKPGIVPDPSTARKEGREEQYFDSLARELEKIIVACQGRTLALFHSRKEMEAVCARLRLPKELPVHMQGRYNAAGAGEKFKKETNSSLFALRSFWTGFDAPGETLSCVTLVRVPFEVPIDPPQIARMAYLQQQGQNAFADHTLPLAKMLMRQGVGRLIRRAEDTGLIALLDPRLRAKRYGEEILDNLPGGMRVFDDLEDAIGFLGL